MALVASCSAVPPNPADAGVGPAAFAQVTQELIRNGAIPILHFFHDLALLHPTPRTSTSAPPPQPVTTQDVEPTIPKAVARIHQACQQTFGSTQPLKFEFEEDAVTHGKRCTLTITRPDGPTRTYASSTLCGRKYDAKASVCALAISNGALDFIYDDPNAEPSSSAASERLSTPLEMDDTVKAIEQCCLEWTGGHVKPFWLNINEPKFGKTQGCALRIRLSPRNSRVYSVNTIYNNVSEARKACAEAALAHGVIDYIRSWTPPVNDMDVIEETDPLSVVSLQQFFDSLPQPFPEPVAGRSAADINGPAWLNTTIQSARGGKIVPNFVWTTDTKYNFHGCLLRLERPGEVRSYLVDARFAKRMEAKAAVCLLAMSEGVGDYIRGVGKAVKERLSSEARKHVSEVLQPLLNAEFRKARGPGIQPTIEYDQDMDACGATMVVELVPNPSPQQVRHYTVPAEYCNRNDARLAVVHRAVQEGVIDFLRLQGRSPPPGYIPYAPQQEQQLVNMNRKRKNWDSSGNSAFGYSAGPRGGDEWSSRPRFGSPSAGGPPTGGWQNQNQNKRQRMGDGFQGNFGYDSGYVHGSGYPFSRAQMQSYGPSGSGGGGSYQQGGPKSAWRNGQNLHVRKSNWKQYPPNANVPGPGSYGGGNAYQYKPGPRSGGPSWSGFAPRQQPVSVPIPSPAVQYPTIPMSSQQQSPPAPPYAYPGGGPVTGSAQPPQAASSGAVPPAQHIPIPYQPQAPQPPVAPFGMPSAAPGVPYSPYAAPLAAPSAPLQYPPQQYPYVAGHPSAPSNGPVAGYQQYAPLPAQPYIPVPPVVSPAPPMPTPPVPSFSTFPYPNFPVAGPANPAHQPLFGQQQQQPPPPPPRQPPIPVPPTIQAPPPPQPSVPPPPSPQPFCAPPPIPASSSTATPQVPRPQPTPPAKLTSTSDPLSSWATKPKNPTKVVLIPSTPKTRVQELYDYCNEHRLSTPQWGQEIPNGDERKHKVWVVIGKMKFETDPLSSLSQAQEKVAGKVVDLFKTQGHAETVKLVGSKA